MKRDRSRFLRAISAFLAFCAMLWVLAGCSNGGSASQAASGSSANGEPKVVRINNPAEPDSLDPWQSASSDTEAIFHNVFEGLCLYDQEGEIVPGLAESWDVSEDGKTYTFHLRQGVVFHNGKAFTSADALYTYETLTGLGGGEPLTQKLSMIQSLSAPDDYTLEVTLNAPSASFLPLTIMAVLPEGYEDQASHPVGTGPFRFVEYVPSQRVVLEKNPDYYRKGADGGDLVKIDRVEVYVMEDQAAVVSALRSGQLDIATMLKADDASLLEGEFDLYHSPQNMAQGLFLNNQSAPLDDLRVRQALCYAVDRDQVVEGAFGGQATKIYSNFSPMMPRYYNEALEGSYETDVEKAKELLREAGYGDGLDLTITVPANYQPHIDTAQILVQQLEAVGVHAKIETMEWATWLERVYGQADYQCTVVGLSGKLDPDAVLGRFESSYSKNFYRFSNAEYDELIQGARVELDDGKRAEKYKRCQEILTQEAVSVFLTDPNLNVACRKDLKGFTFYPVTFYDFSKLYYQ